MGKNYENPYDEDHHFSVASPLPTVGSQKLKKLQIIQLAKNENKSQCFACFNRQSI